jgi:GT2 family glycosyltransferase
MFEKLTELITNGEYKDALYEFQEEFLHIDELDPADAGQLCVLEASIWEALGDSPAELFAIGRGLKYAPYNYELFYMLGLHFLNFNIDKAFLCMQMALFYCENDEDRMVIESDYLSLKADPSMRVRGVSVMILSYNDLEMLKDCIQSVEDNLPKEDLEVVVVDNASTQDGVYEFLSAKEKESDYTFRLIINGENLGFSAGCNIGALACSPDRDIFFLNNDAVLMPNALFFLRMGLYDNRNVGAVSAFSNSASLQEISETKIVESIDDPEILKLLEGESDLAWHKRLGYEKALDVFRKYTRKRDVSFVNPYVMHFRLTGFALLISRDAVNAVSVEDRIFDEIFTPAFFEDDDLGIRISRAGFQQFVCRNSLIYHNGGGEFTGPGELMEESREKFIQKWGFDVWNFSVPWLDAANKALDIAAEKRNLIRIVDFTCGFGATASYIKRHCRTAFVAGVCRTGFEAGIAGKIADDVVFGDPNTVMLPWQSHSFDIVLADTEVVSRGRIAECLARDGIVITQEDFE